MPHRKTPVATHTFNALGTIWHIHADLSLETLEKLANDCLVFQHTYSRFEPASLLYRLNENSVLKSPPSELIQMLQFCTRISEISEGHFNISVGAHLSRDGYGSQMGTFHEDWMDKIEISEEAIVLKDNITLDFGGFGKGWLIDSIYDTCESLGATYIMINGGGDIRVKSATPVALPIMVPGVKDQFFAKALCTSGAIATSSPLLRNWGARKEFNHIITKQGATYTGNIVQVTAYHQTALLADTFATILLLHPHPGKIANKINCEYMQVDTDSHYYTSAHFPMQATTHSL